MVNQNPWLAVLIFPGRSSAWLERLVWDQEVACSNHVAPIFLVELLR